MIQIELRLFGVFKKYAKSGNTVSFDVNQSDTILTSQEIKSRLASYLSGFPASHLDIRLIADSAIANEKRILSSEEQIHNSCSLAILPPVCGG